MIRATSKKSVHWLLGGVIVAWMGGPACDLDPTLDPALADEPGDVVDVQGDAEVLPDHLVSEGPGDDDFIPSKQQRALVGCGTASSVTTSAYEFVDGKTIRLTINWSDSSNSDHDSYDVTVYFYRREGGTLVGPHYSATFSNVSKYARALVGTIGGIDTFDQLGKMSDGTSSLWQVDVRVRVQERCGSTSVYQYSSYRPTAFLTRPYPDANLGTELTWSGLKVGLLERGSLDSQRMYDLRDAVNAGGCQNVLLATSGTLGEAKAGPSGVKGFMRGMGYDCVVNVAYHDRDGGSGGSTDDDSRYYCGSVEIGYYALHYAWLYSVYYTSVNNNNFDMYGHSKGAAVTIRRHQSWPWVSTSYPGGVYYGVGVPEKYGSEYLSSYSLGYTKQYGPIVAMTFSNDPVKDIDACGDIGGAIGLVLSSANHNYNGFMEDHSGHSTSHRYDGDRFRAGTYDWVGNCYNSGDSGC